MSEQPDEALQAISNRTLAHYNASAEQFFEGTRDHDVRQNISALLDAIEAGGRHAPFAILDLGCGPGRDLKALRDMGHAPVGVDGSERFVEMARAWSGCTVWQQDFLALDLPAQQFDGVFANAVLFHVPSRAIAGVLAALHACLKPGGVLFCSNPRGQNQEGWNGPRYGSYYDLEHWSELVQQAGFVLLDHYYRPPGLPRAQQPWLATVWRKQ
ncbi:class I SAM-dependent methyltransferase [Janthinobacterium aquaticum]|uniref:class I SAM-dependent methyltransferase n=1 Tax=Janthinobacterium sp. FT58W TaxID=2654254 RepID=UPI001264A48F|nr:class I SAM-dependent methyltransferase [Janthinobacterium sp. FT58W]KAB8041326.1 methyltransferase domain-containing protein [Janthinobacterium sp. FT58W]